MRAKSTTTLLAAVLSLFQGVVVAQSASDGSKKPIIHYPSGTEEIYHKGDTVVVDYTAFFERVTVWVFCDQPKAARFIYEKKAPGFKGSIPIKLDFTSATICWFNVRSGPDKGGTETNGPGWHILGTERSGGPKTFSIDDDATETTSTTTTTTTSSTASQTSTSSSTTSTPSSSSTTETGGGVITSSDTNSNEDTNREPNGAANASQDQTSNSSSTSSGGLSAGAAAGIGIGATLVVLAMAGGLFFWLRRRKGAAATGEQQEQQQLKPVYDSDTPAPQHPPQYSPHYQATELGEPDNTPKPPPQYKHQYRHATELNSVNAPHEISTSGHGPTAWARGAYEMAG
ncbi:hypothetical protein QBC35DRAFT_507757 [Podospora australis]|uniref:Mid2 domain-containing protein n=1 Tax=Podospora australis TaxID=1536484 RepID=A0AAN6WK99_9PEZI|nr:hypothetical protein QBC35DRAFT_507757 [Podospora australis]